MHLKAKDIIIQAGKDLPWLALGKRNFLYTPGRRHIVNGIHIERTRVAGHFYAWAVELPLWTSRNDLVLDYSYRLNSGISLTGSLNEVSSAIVVDYMQKVSPTDLSKEPTIHTFLERNFRSVKTRGHIPKTSLEYGAGCALECNVKEAVSVLDAYSTSPARQILPISAETAYQLSASLKNEDENYVGIIERIEAETAVRLDIRRC